MKRKFCDGIKDLDFETLRSFVWFRHRILSLHSSSSTKLFEHRERVKVSGGRTESGIRIKPHDVNVVITFVTLFPSVSPSLSLSRSFSSSLRWHTPSSNVCTVSRENARNTSRVLLFHWTNETLTCRGKLPTRVHEMLVNVRVDQTPTIADFAWTLSYIHTRSSDARATSCEGGRRCERALQLKLASKVVMAWMTPPYSINATACEHLHTACHVLPDCLYTEFAKNHLIKFGVNTTLPDYPRRRWTRKSATSTFRAPANSS